MEVPLKVLILSCKTGGGHDSAADAVAERLTQMGIPSERRDFQSLLSEKKSERSGKLYVNVALHIPHIFGAVYHIAKLISHPGGRSPVYLANKKYTEPMYRYIRENGFDTVVTSHLFAAEALTYMRRKYPDSKDIRTYLISTDYTCQPFQDETKPDYVFLPHKDITPEFARAFRKDQMIPTGIPVSGTFDGDMSREEARRALGLDPDKRSILIMTGSMGFGKSDKLIHRFLRFLPKDVQILFLAGNNERLKKRIRKRFGKDPRVITVDYTDKVALYMRASDILFTKTGGLTSTEAAVSGIPIVITSYIPGCETKNAKFFLKHGMAYRYRKFWTGLPSLMRMLDDPDRRQAMIDAQKREINPNAAADICRFMAEKNREGIPV